jgi:hypothetical protein
MNVIRCPHLDRLGRQLIEAYRRLEDHQELNFAAGIAVADNEVARVHRAMSDHRNSCSLCREIHRLQKPKVTTDLVEQPRLGCVADSPTREGKAY